MSYNDETLPYFVQKIPDKVLEVACGEDHTVVVTKSQGEVYVMGSNQRGQLGIGGPSRGSNVPVLLAELSFTKIVKVRAGAFSAGLSMDQQLYLWGTGPFGQFYTPHRVKSVNKFEL
jgi:alpha-tubulin suppressor-like RCC1 family protein